MMMVHSLIFLDTLVAKIELFVEGVRRLVLEMDGPSKTLPRPVLPSSPLPGASGQTMQRGRHINFAAG